MDYHLFTKEAQGDLLRNHLLQTEADNFLHTLQATEAQAVLDAIPPAPPAPAEDPQADLRAGVMASRDDLLRLAATAEKQAEVVTDKLAEIGEPVIKPSPKPAPAQVAESEALQP